MKAFPLEGHGLTHYLRLFELHHGLPLDNLNNCDSSTAHI